MRTTPAMSSVVDSSTSRRRFLQFLAGSPLLAYGGLETRAIMQQIGAPTIKHLVPAMVRRT